MEKGSWRHQLEGGVLSKGVLGWGVKNRSLNRPPEIKKAEIRQRKKKRGKHNLKQGTHKGPEKMRPSKEASQMKLDMQPQKKRGKFLWGLKAS